MRKNGIHAAGIVFVLSLCIALAGMLAYYTTNMQAEKRVPAATAVEITAEDTDENVESADGLQSEEYIIIEDDKVPAGAGTETAAGGVSDDGADGVAFNVLGIVAAILGASSITAVIGVMVFNRKSR